MQFSLSFRPISDVSSDLTVEVGASSLALHKVRPYGTTLVTLIFFLSIFQGEFLSYINLFAHFH